MLGVCIRLCECRRREVWVTASSSVGHHCNEWNYLFKCFAKLIACINFLASRVCSLRHIWNLWAELCCRAERILGKKMRQKLFCSFNQDVLIIITVFSVCHGFVQEMITGERCATQREQTLCWWALELRDCVSPAVLSTQQLVPAVMGKGRRGKGTLSHFGVQHSFSGAVEKHSERGWEVYALRGSQPLASSSWAHARGQISSHFSVAGGAQQWQC